MYMYMYIHTHTKKYMYKHTHAYTHEDIPINFLIWSYNHRYYSLSTV